MHLHQSTLDHKILCSGMHLNDEKLLLTQYELGGLLKFKIYIFYGDNSWTVALRQVKFDTIEAYGGSYKFDFDTYFVRGSV
jgi:hypothetical protein